jgi:hypothetical protein
MTEEDTEEVDRAALGEKYQGLAVLTGNFSNKQQYFFHDVSLQKKNLLSFVRSPDCSDRVQHIRIIGRVTDSISFQGAV